MWFPNDYIEELSGRTMDQNWGKVTQWFRRRVIRKYAFTNELLVRDAKKQISLKQKDHGIIVLKTLDVMPYLGSMGNRRISILVGSITLTMHRYEHILRTSTVPEIYRRELEDEIDKCEQIITTATSMPRLRDELNPDLLSH